MEDRIPSNEECGAAGIAALAILTAKRSTNKVTVKAAIFGVSVLANLFTGYLGGTGRLVGRNRGRVVDIQWTSEHQSWDLYRQYWTPQNTRVEVQHKYWVDLIRVA